MLETGLKFLAARLKKKKKKKSVLILGGYTNLKKNGG